MTLTKNQKSRGTTASSSSPSVARSGRDSGLNGTGGLGLPHPKSSPDVSRTGRGSNFGPNPANNRGVGRGSADKGSGGVARLPGDGVGSDLPSP